VAAITFFESQQTARNLNMYES